MSSPLRPSSADAFTQIQRQVGQKYSLITRFADPTGIRLDPSHREKILGLLQNLDKIIRFNPRSKQTDKNQLLRDTAIQLMHASIDARRRNIVADDTGVVGTIVKAVFRMSSTEALNQLIESLCVDFANYSPFFQAAMILRENLSNDDLFEVLNTLEPKSITEEKLSILNAIEARFKAERTGYATFREASLDKAQILEFLMEPMSKPLAKLLARLVSESSYAMSGNLIINKHIAEELLTKPERLQFLLKKIHNVEADAVPAFLFICTKSPEAFFNNCAKLFKQPLRNYEINYLAASAASLILARNRKDMDADFALNRYGFADTPPAISGSELSKKILTEAQAVIRSSTIFHQGFGALTYAVRSYGATPLLVKAFSAVCGDPDQDIAKIYSRDFNSFPGSGTFIRNINPRKLFNIPEEYSSRKFSISELPERNEAAWAPYAKALAGLENSNFYLTRGAMIISQPNNQDLVLPGDNGELFHYSLVVFNDHFHNRGADIAVLVPTEILTPKLKDCLVTANQRGSVTDINSVGLDISSLEDMAAALGAPLINIASSSCYYGGLCNAYPAGSSPYHEWEHALNSPHDRLTDADGHVHKFFAFPHDGSTTSKQAEIMKKLIEAHDKVYVVADTLLGQLKLLPIILALWNKGTIRRPEEGEATRTLERDEDPMNLGMTDEAYNTWKHCKQIHQHLKKLGVNDRNEFPLLAVTPLNWSKQAKINTWIDTYDMSAVTKTADTQAVTTDLTKLHEEAQEAYFIRQLFIPAADPNLDLRFIHRNTVSKENIR